MEQQTPATDRVAIDPVCGMEVEIATAQHVSDYDDSRYYFCGKGCKLDFDDDPKKYLDPRYVRIM